MKNGHEKLKRQNNRLGKASTSSRQVGFSVLFCLLQKQQKKKERERERLILWVGIFEVGNFEQSFVEKEWEGKG